MGRTARLIVILPRDLTALTDQLAKEKKVSRSQIVSSCLRELAGRRRVAEMVEGYRAVGKEQKNSWT